MARKANFEETISISKQPVAGVTLYQTDARDQKRDLTIDEMLDELEKSELRQARKEELLTRIRERVTKVEDAKKPPTNRNPKRYLVDPETGIIDVDDEEGEYTYKDALLTSASIKGKGGQFDDAIGLINAARTLAEESKPAVEEKKKEYYVDPDTGIIHHDPENGENTLSEARTLSQSIQRTQTQPLPTYFIDAEGNKHALQPGEPAVIKQQPSPSLPQKTFIVRQTAEGIVAEEHDLGKPIIINTPGSGANMPPMMPFPVMDGEGKPVVGQDGQPVYANLEPMMKYMGFQGEQRRADERHSALMGLVQTVKENLPDGIQAIREAAAEARESSKGKTPQQPPGYECGECHTKFTLTREPVEGENVKCPNCGKEWPREEVVGT
ncbi:hypothetical protein ES703_90587 [subsurface metagenome]